MSSSKALGVFHTGHTVKVVVVRLKYILRRSYSILWSTIFIFVITQYNFKVGVYFSLIGHVPKVSPLLAGIAISIADVTKGLRMWNGG